MGLYQRMLGFARPYAGYLLAAVLCSAAAAALETASMYLIKMVMDDGFLNKDPLAAREMLIKLSVGVVLVMGTKGIFRYLADLLNNSASNKMAMDVRQAVFDQYCRLPLSYHTQSRAGELSSHVINDASVMQTGISDVVGKVVGSGLRIIGLVGLILYLNWQLVLQVAIIFPLAMGPLIYFGSKIRRYAGQDQEKLADMNSLLLEVLSGFRVMLAFNSQAREQARFKAVVSAHYAALMKKLRAAALSSPVMESIGGLGVALMIYLAGLQVVDQHMSLGSFFSLIGAIFSLYPPAKALNGVNVSIAGAMAAGARVFAVLDTVPAVQDKAGAKEARPLQKALSFDKAAFSYRSGHPVLKGLSFSVNAGQRVALVGPSGAGKSTLADLLPRFHDLESGAILWDGIDLRDLSQQSLRAQIGVVTQETFLFNESIAANIAYGRPSATQAQIEAAAKAANAHAFIEQQPQGYATLVGERGTRLSGGQRQRLAIARALLKDAPVLILDEATSALDTESERAVQEALDRLMAGRTTLVIAHRLSTVQHADKIVVLDKGSIVEEGKHAVLLKKRGLYARLYKMQFAKPRKAAKRG